MGNAECFVVIWSLRAQCPALAPDSRGVRFTEGAVVPNSRTVHACSSPWQCGTWTRKPPFQTRFTSVFFACPHEKKSFVRLWLLWLLCFLYFFLVVLVLMVVLVVKGFMVVMVVMFFMVVLVVKGFMAVMVVMFFMVVMVAVVVMGFCGRLVVMVFMVFMVLMVVSVVLVATVVFKRENVEVNFPSRALHFETS